jgi:5-hydroxyisourate hydrolase-like protein (transthyretin family)
MLLAALLLAAPAIATAAIEGKVINRTTGQPAAGVLITLLKFEGGMDPIEEVSSGEGGAFTFQKALLGANGSPVPGMLRAEYQGVSYSEMLPPGRPAEGLEVSVYSVDDKQTLAPSTHIMIFEPGGEEMVVKDVFAFVNDSSPPRAYRDAENGTLRFYLPPEAKGIVQVSASGPQRMPLRSVATRTSEANVYMVDFPIKPGENTIELTYLVPFSDGVEFQSRVLYEGLKTRMAAPEGVTLAGEGLVFMDQEPRTKASIYDLAPVASFSVKVSGQGQLSRAGGEPQAAAAPGGGNEIRIAPAPVAKELYWVLGLTSAVLLVGFYYLYTARQPEPAAASATAADAGEAPKRSPAQQPAQRRPARQRKA